MPYLGKQPASVPVTADDIPDNSITAAKIVDGGITAADIGADAVGLSELSATGTASTSTFLRGDNAWVAVDTNLVSDNSPQLGGDLDLNSNNITGTGGIPAANLTGTIAAARLSTATTQSASDNSTKIATTAYTDAQVATVVDSAPGTLNTLNELAAALGDDANFSTTVTNSIAAKLPLAGGTMTGNIAHAGAFTIDTVGDISLDSEGAILIKNGGSAIGRISNSNSDMIIKSDTSDKDILFKGNDGGSTITALTLDMSSQGDAYFNRHVKLPDNGNLVLGGGDDLLIYHDHANQQNKIIGTTTTIIGSDLFYINNAASNENMLKATANGSVELYHNNVKKLETTAAGATVTGDLTVTDSDMQLTTKSAIGTAEHEAGGGFSNVGNSTASSRRAMMWLDADGANFGGSDYYYIEKTGGGGVQHILQNSADMKFATNGTDRMSINANGNIGIAENTPIRKFHIAGSSGNSSTMLIHMDADTAGGECGIEFKADSTNDDRRVKAAIKFRRDDPGTRGTGNLHFCVNGDNNDVNVSTSNSRMMLNTDGLHFNGDTAAANALDDYEEGATAVGSIVVKDGSTTLTCGTGAGIKYTKIGNTVRVQFEFRVTNLNGAGGGSNFKMGLPFQNVAGGYATGSNRIYNGNVAGGEFIAVDSEDTYMKFRRNVNGSATVSQTAATNAYYFGTIVYQTT